MTNEEAIENLKGCVCSYEVDNYGKPNGNVTADLTQEIIEMAIKALEQENVLEKIRAEIEKKRTRAKQMSSVLQMNAYTDCLQIIDKCRKEDVE